MPDGWSYFLLTIHNPQLGALEERMNELGEDGWELVAGLTTVKWVAAIGNQLVFVFKKPGSGHRPPAEASAVVY